jgi:hypothetical protein
VEFVGRAIGALVGAIVVGTTAVDEPDVENRHTSRPINTNNRMKTSCRFNLKRIVALFSMYRTKNQEPRTREQENKRTREQELLLKAES